MAKMKGESRASEPKRTEGPITAENYLERVGSFLRLGGVPFVIRGLDGEKGAFRTREAATEPQWLAWRTWFISKGITRMVRVMDSHGLATVPSEYPELFDTDAPPSDPFARMPRRAPVEMDRMSGRLSALFSGLTREVGAWPGDKRRERPNPAQAKAEAERMLAEKVADWSRPAALSPQALKLARPAAMVVDDEEINF